MLNDTDSWPVTCAVCDDVFPREIGKLKQTANITCPRCRTDLTFRAARFVNMIEQLKGHLSLVAGNTVLTETQR
jgi:hypothetical protein